MLSLDTNRISKTTLRFDGLFQGESDDEMLAQGTRWQSDRSAM